MLPYLYSTGYETTQTGVPMMRAMLLEYPEDLTARNLSTQYMLGSSLLVAPVFDQRKHMIYLPQGSWVDLETGERLCGSRWVEYPKQIDVIPLFLRENTMIPMLDTAPDHIDGSLFQDLTLILNLTGKLEQAYTDDSVSGCCHAEYNNGTICIRTENIPANKFVIYCDREVAHLVINGNPTNFRMDAQKIISE